MNQVSNTILASVGHLKSPGKKSRMQQNFKANQSIWRGKYDKKEGTMGLCPMSPY